MEHTLHYELDLPAPQEEVFAFFADATNLQEITPPELNFTLVTPPPIEIRKGALIDYRLGLFGVRFGWRTLISEWEPPHRFVDEQLKGPYALWHHTHTFAPAPGGGTRVTDDVRYRLPLSPLGDLALPVVKLQLQRIFGYRQERMRAKFGTQA